jgi:hypothetical protein
VSLADADQLALRLAVPKDSGDNRFDVAITDTRGGTAQLGSVTVTGLPGKDNAALWAQEVRIPLPGEGIDLSSVASLSLSPAGGGEAWLMDAYGWSAGLPDPDPVALPRVDVGTLTVEEGDEGTRTYQVPVSVTGDGVGELRLFVSDEKYGFTSRLVTVQPGQDLIEVPFEVAGNTRWDYDTTHVVLVKALRGTMSGGYVGGLTVTNDDPSPTVTLTPNPTVTEGDPLTWTATASAVADAPMYLYGTVLAPESGAELSTTDVDPEWFLANSFGEEVEPSRPLSSTQLSLLLEIKAGDLTATVTIPTVADTVAEPSEYVRFSLEAWPSGDTVEIVGPVTEPLVWGWASGPPPPACVSEVTPSSLDRVTQLSTAAPVVHRSR